MKSIFKWILLGSILVSTSAFAQPAPPFTLNDAQGNAVSLEDYRGKVVILHFWATWCPYCKRVQPGLDALYQEYQDQGVELLGISWGEDPEARPQQALIKRGHSFKTLVRGEPVAEMYGVQGTPTTLFISREGELIGVTQTSNPQDPGLREAVLYMLNLGSL